MASSLFLRASAYALSAGAHVAVMAVTFGHASPGVGRVDAPMVLTENVVPIDVAPAEVPVPEAIPARQAAGSPTPPTHTHPYPVPFDHDAHPHDPSLVHAPIGAHAPDHDDHDHDHAPPETAAAAVADAPVAHFTMTIASGAHAGGTGAATHGAAMNDAHEGTDASPMAEAHVSAPAHLVGAVNPAYPAAARQDEIEADVALEIVVARDGRVLDARVTRPAGNGFDEEALRAVRAARFTPAVHDGAAVAVRMRWTVSFRLR